MSLNLGPQAYEAINRLKGNSDWRALVDALEAAMAQYMYLAVEVPSADRADAGGYARCLRDLVRHVAQVERPDAGGRAPKIPLRREAAHV
jgi:hypothetical protein